MTLKKLSRSSTGEKGFLESRLPLVFFCFCILVCATFPARQLDSAQRKSEAPETPKAVQKGEARDDRDHSKGYIECTGKVRPQQSFSLRLRPGERVVRYLVKEGDRVNKGDQLVQLTSDAIAGELEALHKKEAEIEEYKDQIELLDLKIRMTQESVGTLKERIAEERKIMNEVPGYLLEGKVREWVSEMRQKEDSLVILRKELTLLEKRVARAEALKGTRIARRAVITAQAGNLLVTAPFSGLVKRTNKYFQNAAPGDLVLELWDTRGLQVEALVWQHQLPYVTTGSRVKILPDYFKDAFVWGTIRFIGHPDTMVKEEGFPVFPVIIDVNANNLGLTAGMAVTVRISYSRESQGK